MSLWIRFARFNAVSALGVVVQVGTLAALTRWTDPHYAAATVAAVGTAVVHNFVWHRRWTWADRAQRPLAAAFAAFSLGNGLVSVAVNLAVMTVLVGLAGAPPVPANLVGIAAAGLVNFWIGDRVVFGVRRAGAPSPWDAGEPPRLPIRSAAPESARYGSLCARESIRRPWRPP